MIKQPILFILMLLAFSPVLFMGSCTSENMVSACDTLNMTYSQNIAPIIKTNCYLCHSRGNTSTNGGVLLDSYADVRGWATIIRIDTTQPKNADSSYLVGNIKHLPPTSILHFTPMPYKKPMLDACTINQIVAWVNQGTKE